MRNLYLLVFCLWGFIAYAQQPAANPADLTERIRNLEEKLDFALQTQDKSTDDLLWYQRVGDVALVDKIRYTSKPPHVIRNPTGQGATNPLVIPAYTFIPRKYAADKKLPLIVFVHGGVHSDFNSSYAHIVRELIEQGYIIIAPEYRGSTGYGGSFYKQIDYGDYENDDVLAGKRWAVENLPQVDPDRVGIMGWSHGGMITLMNIFDHADDYKVAYAGVPVSDMIARMGYKNQSYRNEFSAATHIGKDAADNVAEYRRRSPVWNAQKLKTPLLIHTNTNDEDVNVLEVESLINALKANGKKFDYKIYQDAPGGHIFNRIDTRLAKESRQEIYRFLGRQLTPPNAVK
ncbi:alpha/beta hydrolase family protein [Spirosoma sordidisoli]|uniref:S9 family peptidase n=1 Tax=Spirosoma sordidisoli TaxID=2502893 RepID=A0A4Q2UPI6_9BACT|nr:alpha/beta fold hydrolase [Spirosoma sordidisoli]RYC71613.1 S9 family peptidase [Spirosoma sordidisoli]